jgi:hypothetical protein
MFEMQKNIDNLNGAIIDLSKKVQENSIKRENQSEEESK